MKKLVNMVLALAVLAVFSFGCGGYAAKDGGDSNTLKDTRSPRPFCSSCGVKTDLTEEMIRFQRESAH